MVSIIDLEFFNEVTPEQEEFINGGATALVPDVDFNGGDIQLIRNSNIVSCRQAVDNNPQAIFGIYNVDNKNCFLKGRNVTPLSTQASIGIIHLNPN